MKLKGIKSGVKQKSGEEACEENASERRRGMAKLLSEENNMKSAAGSNLPIIGDEK